MIQRLLNIYNLYIFFSLLFSQKKKIISTDAIDLIKFGIFDKIFVKVKILMIIYDYIYKFWLYMMIYATFIMLHVWYIHHLLPTYIYLIHVQTILQSVKQQTKQLALLYNIVLDTVVSTVRSWKWMIENLKFTYQYLCRTFVVMWTNKRLEVTWKIISTILNFITLHK